MAATVQSRDSYTSYSPVTGGCGPVSTHHLDGWLAASVYDGHCRNSMSGYLSKNDIGGGVVVNRTAVYTRPFFYLIALTRRRGHHAVLAGSFFSGLLQKGSLVRY